MIFRKHKFSASQWEELKAVIEVIQTSPEGEITRVWNPELIALLHELPPMCEAWGQDEKGRPLCLQHSNEVVVDIVWRNEVHVDFVPYLVWPEGVGSHSLGETLDREYMHARQNFIDSSNL